MESEEGSEALDSNKQGQAIDRKEYMISVKNVCDKCDEQEMCRPSESSKLIMLSKPSQSRSSISSSSSSLSSQ